MNSHRIERVVIVGGGTAGWLSALHLKTVLGDATDVVLIESADVPTIGVGEGTQPTLRRHLADLRIDELQCVRECGGSFKNGIRFDRWFTGQSNDHYLHPFLSGPSGTRNSAYAPFHVWLAQHRRAAEAQPALADACFPESALIRHKKAPLGFQNGKRMESPVANYAFHIDAARLGVFLRQFAVARGVRHLVGHVQDIELGSQGEIHAVHTKEHGRAPGDFFVDCTGFRRLLIGKLDSQFLDFGQFLLNDRAVTARVPHDLSAQSGIESATISTALPHGWVWLVPQYERIGAGYVYSSKFVSDADAEREFVEFLGYQPDQLGHVRFKTGCLKDAWVGNCVAIGLSGGFIEPLEATGIAIITYSLYRLMENWPQTYSPDPLRKRFNQQMLNSYLWVRDFIAMHFCLSQREDSEYWRAVRSSEAIPDSLQQTLELLEHGWPFGEPADDNSRYTLPGASLVCVLAGFHRFPGAANCYVENLPPTSLKTLMRQSAQRIAATEQVCRDHRQVLDSLHASNAKDCESRYP